MAALKRGLRPALDKLRTSNIAPVDLAQSAIGPGIGVYSRFSKVLEPTGSVYGKNSVDIVIVDGSGKVVRRYQSKYCKDAEATAKAFGHNYRGQRKLVPDGQEGEVGKNATNVLEAPDGTKSKPLSKEGADKLQKEAQSGSWKELDWNEYKLKDVAVGIGKQAGQAALMGAAVGAGFEVANKLWNGEKIDGEELVEKALTSGADFGVKAAAAGALKVGAEKGIIKCLQGTPAGTIANMANIAIENVKVLGRMADGQLTAKEGLEKMEEVSISSIGGIMASAKGMGIGATVGSVLGPIGTAAGAWSAAQSDIWPGQRWDRQSQRASRQSRIPR